LDRSVIRFDRDRNVRPSCIEASRTMQQPPGKSSDEICIAREIAAQNSS
jgi:hypothetical protein